MKKKTTIDLETDNLQLCYWDEEKEESIPIFHDNEVEEFLKRPEWKRELISAINAYIEMQESCLRTELLQLWDRVEKLEEKLVYTSEG